MIHELVSVGPAQLSLACWSPLSGCKPHILGTEVWTGNHLGQVTREGLTTSGSCVYHLSIKVIGKG